MARAQISKHGRDHRKAGHDPIPTAQESVVDGGTTNPVTSGSSTDLLWSHSAGDTLFDYSDPSKPLLLAAGIYSAVMVAKTSAAFSSPGWWRLSVRFGEAGTAPIMFFDETDLGPDADPAGASVGRIVVPAWDLPAGAECNVHIVNQTGGSLSFTLGTSYIQRIY